MAETATLTPPSTTNELVAAGATDATAHNAEIAAKLANQDASGHSMAGKEGDNLDGMAALDKLRDERKAALEKAATEKEDADDAAPAAPAKVEPAAAAKPPTKETPKDNDSTDNTHSDKGAGQPASDIFAGIDLPPHAKPKSVEAWTALKIKASQEIAARDQKLAEAAAKQKELEAKLQNPIPEDTAKELEELRAFRAKLDVDLDPKFREFDKKVNETHEFIYEQLRQNGVIGEEGIEKMKKLGGPDPSKVNMDAIFEAMKDPALQRRIEAKMADVEMLRYQKEQAVKATKDNVGQYMKEREEAFKSATTHHNTATKTRLGELMGRLDYFQPKTVKADADAATKKEAEEHNSFVKDVQGQIEGALNDDSPEMRAIMLAGMAQLIYLQKVHEKSLASHKVEKETLEKQVKELTVKTERFTKASVGRLQESAAPADGKGMPVKKTDDFSKPAAQSLDEIRADMIAKRQAAGV